MKRSRPAVHRTVLVVDVEGYGDGRRTTPHRLAVRDGLYRALRQAFDQAGAPWADCCHQDIGDGLLVLVPAELPKSLFVESLPDALADALRRHNETHLTEERIRLRMALHAGEVVYDDHGMTSPAINLTFRLVAAHALRSALAGSPGMLALITSAWFFEEVVRHSQVVDAARFRRVRVVVKETDTTGWLALPDHPYPPDTTGLEPVRVLAEHAAWPEPQAPDGLPWRWRS